MRAYCWASGLIEFGNKVPSGAIEIAHGRTAALRAFIEVRARHGYQMREVNGRRIKIPGSETLLVPGLPEAPDQAAAADALRAWCDWIGDKLPVGVKMSVPMPSAPALQAAE